MHVDAIMCIFDACCASVWLVRYVRGGASLDKYYEQFIKFRFGVRALLVMDQ